MWSKVVRLLKKDGIGLHDAQTPVSAPRKPRELTASRSSNFRDLASMVQPIAMPLSALTACSE
jgi:hypothetical protein